MNKKGFIFGLFLFLFSFCFICRVSAYTQNGVELTDTFFSNGWTVIENNLNYDRMDYPYVFCYSDNSNVLKCVFFKNSSTNYRSYQDYIGYGYRVDNTITDESTLPAFTYNKSNNTYSSWNWTKSNSYFYPGYPMNTNVDYYYNGSKVKSKSFDYTPTSPKKTINFNLNGGSVMDLYDLLDPITRTEDYSLQLDTSEFISYMKSITPFKNNHSFMGWYYDSSFTNQFVGIINLLDFSQGYQSGYLNANGVFTSDTKTILYNQNISVSSDKTYNLSMKNPINNFVISFFDSNDTFLRRTKMTNVDSYSFTPDSDVSYIKIAINIDNNTITDDKLNSADIILEEGDSRGASLNLSSNVDLYAKFRSDIYGTSNIDYIEFKFDNIPNMETNISFDYMFRSVSSDGTENTIDFAQPFGREYYIGCDDDSQTCSSDVRYKDDLYYDLGFIGYYYTHSADLTLNSDPEHSTQSYSVIVPLENSFGNYVYLNFNSNDDYEIIIHYKDDVDSNSSFIETVDITGKYGAVFLPLYDDSPYVSSDSYYLTNFRVVGDVDIQMTDSRDLSNYNIYQIYSMNYCNNSYISQNDIPYSCDNLTGVFTFKIDNLTVNQTLRFVNHSYSELSDRRTFIEYDSRFFNYGILDTPYSTVEIIDPTTGNTETVGLSEFYNYFNQDNIENSKFNFSSAFNRFLSPIKFIFKCITSLYNNYLNDSLQHYFFLVFSLSIIILIIRIIF